MSLLALIPLGKFIIDIAYNLIIRLLGLIFYLASEYWGRWVLAALIIAIGLLYGRYHYIQVGRQSEIRFCELRIDDALREAKRGKGQPKPGGNESFLDDWFKLP